MILSSIIYLFIKAHNLYSPRDDMIRQNLSDLESSCIEKSLYEPKNDYIYYYYNDCIDIIFDNVIILDNFIHIHSINFIIHLLLEQPYQLKNLDFFSGILLPGITAGIPIPVLQEQNNVFIIDLITYIAGLFVLIQI